jgi:hypothetical protein
VWTDAPVSMCERGGWDRTVRMVTLCGLMHLCPCVSEEGGDGEGTVRPHPPHSHMDTGASVHTRQTSLWLNRREFSVVHSD